MKTRSSLVKITYLLIAFVFLATLLVTPASTAQMASSELSSYIVQGSDVDQVVSLVEQYGGEITSRLDIINGVGATLSQAAVNQLLTEAAISAITPNGQMQIDGGATEDTDKDGKKSKSKKTDKGFTNQVPETNYPEISGATAVWEAGVIGEGIGVAVIDTGIGNHNGLKKDIYRKNGRLTGWVDFVDGKKRPLDPNGHGTHIAGVIANSQVGSDGKWNGVAPGVDLIGIRVADKEGFATYELVI